MKDFNGYVKRMSYALDEKLSFVDEVDLRDFDVLIDFGCGDGTLLNAIVNQGYFAGEIIAYDNSREMINLAIRNNPRLGEYIYILSDLIKEVNVALLENKKVFMIFSSVWHEITDRAMQDELLRLMTKIHGFYIRDMYYDSKTGNETLSDTVISNIKYRVSPQILSDFTERYGELKKNDENFYHFVLKYTYVDNWETELEENYFSTPWKRIINLLKLFDFKVWSDDIHTLNFKKEQVLKDFRYELKKPTHRKLIMIQNNILE